MTTALEEYQRVVRELEARIGNDPLRGALKQLTPAQRSFVDSNSIRKVIKGGNRSGKTWTAAQDFMLDALGMHPTFSTDFPAHWSAWEGWWCAVSYEMFAQQTWDHFKRLLLYPGESAQRLPTRRILEVGWLKLRPETPNFIMLKRDDGRIAKIYIKTIDQGRRAFQGAGPNRLHVDEEFPGDIIDELQLRTLDRRAVISHSATPVEGADYLRELEDRYNANDPDVYHVRLSTADNPSLDKASIEETKRKFKNDPEMLRLRLEGYEMSRQGLVYNDKRFTREHVVTRYAIPANWTRYRAIDHGYRHFVCLWFAVAPKNDRVVLYKEYHGQQASIKENCDRIVGYSAGENILNTVIDKATQQHNGAMDEYGQAVRTIDLYKKYGVPCVDSPNHQEDSGVAAVWDLLYQTGPDGKPLFQVFSDCEYFLHEIKNFKYVEDQDHKKDKSEKPDTYVDRFNHAMDAWRYFVVSKWGWREPLVMTAPPAGTLARKLFDDRAGAGRKKERSL